MTLVKSLCALHPGNTPSACELFPESQWPPYSPALVSVAAVSRHFQSCRLATGFEIQTWAFVPRVSILLPDGNPINFSSTDCPGIEHLIDVSAGLFRSDGGSRLESLLDWCTSRVSFAEEAVRGRTLLSAQRGNIFVQGLGTAMLGDTFGCHWP